MTKLLRIDLDKQGYRLEKMPTEYADLGGRGLSSKIISKEVPPKTDPLGPKNKLIFSAGILAGTAFPNSGRLSVGAKSPLTNGIKEANAGSSSESPFQARIMPKAVHAPSASMAFAAPFGSIFARLSLSAKTIPKAYMAAAEVHTKLNVSGLNPRKLYLTVMKLVDSRSAPPKDKRNPFLGSYRKPFIFISWSF